MKDANGRGKHRWEGVILDWQMTFNRFFNDVDMGLK